MKVKIISTLLLLFFLMSTFEIVAQDIIYKTDGTEIKAKIIEIEDIYIKFKKFEQPDGPIRNIKKEEVFLIIYQDGTREKFTTIKSVDNSQNYPQQNPQSGQSLNEQSSAKIQNNSEKSGISQPFPLVPIYGNAKLGRQQSAERSKPEYKFQKSGYINIIEFGPIVIFSPSSSAVSVVGRINMINGALFNPYLSLGLGIGYEYWPDGNLLPIYLDLRVNFIKRRFSPCLVINGGYALGWVKEESGANWGGFLVNPAFGFRGYISKYFAMAFTVGYKLQFIRQKQTELYYDGQNYTYREYDKTLTVNGISIKLGFIF